MTKRKIALIVVLLFTEVLIPAGVVAWIYFSGIELTFASIMDHTYAVHRIPVDVLAQFLITMGSGTTIAVPVAEIVLGLMEVGLVLSIAWILAPYYREAKTMFMDMIKQRTV